jgi:hypothetical protein
MKYRIPEKAVVSRRWVHILNPGTPQECDWGNYTDQGKLKQEIANWGGCTTHGIREELIIRAELVEVVPE